MEKFFEANVELWRNCNFDCSFCIGAKLGVITNWHDFNLNLDKLVKFINNNSKWKLLFLGGEVFINPYFASICKKLIDNGHELSFLSNGSIKLDELFEEKYIKKFSRITFSYHPIHENNKHYDDLFNYNLKLMKNNNVPCGIVYVTTPERIKKIDSIKEKFNEIGVDVNFTPLYGDFNGKNYPTSYTEDEVDYISKLNSSILSKYQFENGGFKSTFRKCRAGYNRFHISLNDGKIVQCEQFNYREMFNFLKEDYSDFEKKIYKEPVICMANNCVCGYNMDIEKFLSENKTCDLNTYEEFKKICSYNEKAIKYWMQQKEKFKEYISNSLKGNKVFIWGGGVHTSKLLELFSEIKLNIDIIAIIDSNPKKGNQSIKNIPIIFKDVFYNNYIDECTDIIISSMAFEKDIYNEIKDFLGNKINIIKLYDNNTNIKVPI